jgi:hypothetical protein
MRVKPLEFRLELGFPDPRNRRVHREIGRLLTHRPNRCNATKSRFSTNPAGNLRNFFELDTGVLICTILKLFETAGISTPSGATRPCFIFLSCEMIDRLLQTNKRSIPHAGLTSAIVFHAVHLLLSVPFAAPLVAHVPLTTFGAVLAIVTWNTP